MYNELTVALLLGAFNEALSSSSSLPTVDVFLRIHPNGDIMMSIRSVSLPISFWLTPNVVKC